MIDYKKELNDEQYKVVSEGNGPCLVLAGAGSGKTRTVTYRVAKLLEDGVDPKSILLVTFTNKASREMMERVEALTKGKSHLPWAGTFHHIGYRMLKKYAPLLGYTSQFSVLDSEDSRDIFKLCIKQEGVDRKARRFPSPKVIQSMISYARNASLPLEQVVQKKYPNFAELIDILGRIASDYDKRKKAANVMDFDDLLVNTYLLLVKSESVRNTFASQFKYVMVDEYQDTNKIQSSIIKAISSFHNNILVVGDDAQSIYSFRAADIQNILSFEDHFPGAQIFRLETNYRSTPEILNVANDIISRNVSQYEKELKSVQESFMRPEVHAFADQFEEANFIADTILTMRDEGVPLSEMAVLFRASFHSQQLEMELAKRDIPYEYRGGIRFFERSHVKDVLCYLRIINNIDDTVAWSRVLNMQVGIGPASAQKIIEALNNITNIEEIEGLGSLLSKRAKIGFHDFLSIWKDLIDEVERTPSNLIQVVLDSKYKDYLQNEYPDYRERMQDIEQLALFAEKQDELTQFLAEATMQEAFASARRNDVRNSNDDEKKLILSTIHQAKGLEWQGVFIMNVAQGAFPSQRSTSREDIEEERRLFYVSVTRAKKYLYMSYPLTGLGSSFLQGPSQFLEEIRPSLLSQSRISGSSVFNDPSDEEDDIVYEPFEEEWGTKKHSFLKSIDDL